MPKDDGQYLPPVIRTGRAPEPTYRCLECLDVGWVHSTVDAMTVRPCRQCAKVTHRRWAEGHFVLDHACDECAGIRAGRITELDFAADGSRIGAT